MHGFWVALQCTCVCTLGKSISVVLSLILCHSQNELSSLKISGGYLGGYDCLVTVERILYYSTVL